jgi:hypothetical protein
MAQLQEGHPTVVFSYIDPARSPAAERAGEPRRSVITQGRRWSGPGAARLVPLDDQQAGACPGRPARLVQAGDRHGSE